MSNSICKICGSWMSERPGCEGWLRCPQGHQIKIVKRIVKPVGKKK